MKIYDDGNLTVHLLWFTHEDFTVITIGFLMPCLPDAKSGFCIGSLVGFLSDYY